MSAKWTEPGEVKCFFCHKEEHGYALKDDKNEWQPACWACAKKAVKEDKNGNG